MCSMFFVNTITHELSCQITSADGTWHLYQRTQNRAQGSTMNFQIFSPKNCHYEKVRFILTRHNFHNEFLQFCNWKCTPISEIQFKSHKSYVSTIVTLTFQSLLQFQHQCCTCETSIGNINKAFASTLTAAPSILIGRCNIHTLKGPVCFITNKMHLSTSYSLFYLLSLSLSLSLLPSSTSSFTTCTLLSGITFLLFLLFSLASVMPFLSIWYISSILLPAALFWSFFNPPAIH